MYNLDIDELIDNTLHIQINDNDIKPLTNKLMSHSDDDFIDADIFNSQTLNQNSSKPLLICTECKSTDISDKDEYCVCLSCGTVLSNIISNAAEWLNYQNDVNKSRCAGVCSDINPYINNLSTFIPKGSKSFVMKEGKYISSDISMLHIQNTYNHRQKSFSKIENLLDTLCNKYHPLVIKEAKKMWIFIMEKKKITRAGKRIGLLANCVYYSCIIHNCPISAEEISKDFGNLDNKNFNMGSKVYRTLFQDSEWAYVFKMNGSIESYFNRFAYKLEENNIIDPKSSFLLARKSINNYNIFKNKLTSMSPKSIVSGVLYYTCIKNYDPALPVTKNKIATTCDVCIPTLTKILDIITQE